MHLCDVLQVQKLLRDEKAREAERQRQEREIAAAIKSHNESVKQKQNASATSNTSAASADSSSKTPAAADQPQPAATTASTSSAPVRPLNTSYTIQKPAAQAASKPQQQLEASSQESSDSCVDFLLSNLLCDVQL